jgi:RNA polymerase sigma-70 factor (ECF subfamily)
MTDKELRSLLISVSSGEHAAFRKFYDHFYLKVYRFTSLFLSDATDCKIVISDVFCLLWEKRILLPNINNVEAYLYKMIRNASFYYLKKEKNANILSLEDMPVEFSVTGSTQIDDEILEDEMMKVLEGAVNSLPERCKLIFLMVREQKMSHKEVAEILSITPGTVEVQMNTAIKKITSIVSSHYPHLIKKAK